MAPFRATRLRTDRNGAPTKGRGMCFRCRVIGYRATEFVRRRGWSRLYAWLLDCRCEPAVWCPEVAVNHNAAGLAMCNREAGHDGTCQPHPDFWAAV